MQSSITLFVNRFGSGVRIRSLSSLVVTTTNTISRNTTTRFRSMNHTTGIFIYTTAPESRLVRNFSMAPAAAKEGEPRRKRRTLETKDPIEVTERAAHRIKEILQGDTAEGAIGIRLGVKRRGCNGLSYTLNYAFEKPKKDLEMESNGVKVFVDPMALFNVVGTVMDWEETELSSEFTFKNPNSKGECGCGESFTV
mmetsp:Transcript_54983/g.61424  ORF Transcript_54983/g.61424 Transcript_54983/m.61424 type:complete len:196 (-) Transcript_54983:112-699(-)